MGWNGVVVASIPSWWALRETENVVVWLALAAAIAMVSCVMYVTLVYYSGAVPSEYYSVQKRPDCAEYHKGTNRFFLGRLAGPTTRPNCTTGLGAVVSQR